MNNIILYVYIYIYLSLSLHHISDLSSICIYRIYHTWKTGQNLISPISTMVLWWSCCVNPCQETMTWGPNSCPARKPWKAAPKKNARGLEMSWCQALSELKHEKTINTSAKRNGSKHSKHLKTINIHESGQSYKNSLSWNKAILGWFLLLTMIPVRENSEVVIILPTWIRKSPWTNGCRTQEHVEDEHRCEAGQDDGNSLGCFWSNDSFQLGSGKYLTSTYYLFTI